ncbi:hypothetical protein [Paraburkholderia lacunae]|uniref:Uncharacterized protein n=1 Tax=Paraburkholderia lacunae TaxID=2211104 RepID=A0A370MW85_9BURK|nr:hypothetical protein [Paraburkholderia lacunae]RDJ97584.1 hypothetical protein DLM46_37085 [Paraburkholderia lacunae]
MKHASSSFQGTGEKGRVSIKGDTLWLSSRSSQTHDGMRAPTPNWAWAHRTESYDWMDSHSPFTAADLSD